MAMTMTQKLLAEKAGLSEVTAGQLIEAPLDMVLGNDITTPVAIKELEKAGIDSVFDRERIALVLDHFVPNKDIKAARQCTIVREFAKKHEITHFYDVGEMGIEHCLLPELGLAAPGDCIIGADSHTCTYGALGCFSTGVGSTDMAAAMATGKSWFKVPSAMEVSLRGSFRDGSYTCGKDVILSIIGSIGVDGARYMSMEFCGDGIQSLSIDERFTIANMTVEAGAKNGIFPVDDVCREYCENRVKKQYKVYNADSDAYYEKRISVDLGSLEPLVAMPSLPSNIDKASNLERQGIPVQQVVIGSCTNGRLSDLQIAASILKGKHIAKGVRCIIIPGTQAVWLAAMREGLFDTFIEAGAIVSTPTCGPCLGGYMGILDEGELAISTTNRNFVGRMGHPKSLVALASPATAAASALTGCITAPASI